MQKIAKIDCLQLRARLLIRRTCVAPLVIMLGLVLSTQAAQHAVSGVGPLERYDVSWSTPSRDSSGSMPLGNGDIGLNLWVEQDGDLFFYIGKTDAWSENVRLLTLGRVSS